MGIIGDFIDKLKDAASGSSSGVSGGGFRDVINRNPLIVMGAAALVVVVAVIWSAMSLFGGSSSSGFGGQNLDRGYFTSDDGATYFEDSIENLPPFDKDGKTAVRAHVFTCNRGKDRFIGYLERYRTDVKQKLIELNKDPTNMENAMARSGLMMSGVEVKKPGEPPNKWVSSIKNVEFAAAMSVNCPEGKGTELEAVIP